jgi:hypothetical protein
MNEPRGAKASLVRLLDVVALYFPGLLILSWIYWFYALICAPTGWRLLVFCVWPYLVPLVLYRLVHALAPIREGRSVLKKGAWSSWFVSYRLQLIYGYVPFLENALLAIPGLFNWWLRAWGSRVGRGVFWASTVQITDRGLLDIGNDVFFGTAIFMASHVVRRRNGKGVLYVKRVTIEPGCFIGAGCRLGPGSIVREGAVVPLLTDLYLREEYPPKQSARTAQ